MKKSAFLLLLNIGICLFSFTKLSGQTIIPIKENLAKTKTVNLSEIASDIRFVALETTDDCLLGDDCYIQYVDGQIFVSSKILYRFDGKTGKFLNKIGSIGQGPGEYTHTLRYTINPKTKRVYILIFKTMLEYDYEGNYLRTLPADNHNVGACSMLNDTQVVYANDAYNYTTEDQSDQLYIVDLEKEKIVGKISSPVEKKLRGALNLSAFDFFYTYNGQVYFKGSFQDEIYRIQSPKKKVPAYVCDRGYLKTDYSKKNAEIDPRNRMKGIQIQNLFETDKYLLVSYIYEKNNYQGLFNKQDHSFINVADKKGKAGFTNNLTGGPSIIVFPFQINPDGMIVTAYNAAFLIEHQQEYQISNPLLPARKAEWDNVLKNLTEESNPVIMLMSIKSGN